MPKIIENLKENILTEGKRLLLTKSYKDLSIRDIAKNCNIGTGTFYNYFSTKQDLVLEILREDWSKISYLINNLKGSDIPCKEKFRQIYMSLEDFISSYMSIFYEMAIMNGYSDECREFHKFDMLYRNVSELIDIERQRGNITSTLTSYELSQLIISNLIYLNKNKYITFDMLYDSIRI